MNKAYKVIYNETTGTYVAVSELETTHGKAAHSIKGISFAPLRALKPFKCIQLSQFTLATLGIFTVLAMPMAHASWVNHSSGGGGVANGGTNIGGNGYGDAATASSIAIGTNDTSGRAFARDNNTTAIGDAADAVSTGATAIGASTHAEGNESTALGFKATTYNEGGTALGSKTIVKGVGATAIGYNANTDGASSLAVGADTVVFGNRGIAIGSKAQALAAQAMAIGTDAQALGTYAIAIGDRNIASMQESIAVGLQNKVLGEKASTFGHRNVVYDYHGLAVGHDSVVDGDASVSVGSESLVAGANSASFGNDNNITGTYNTVTGINNKVGTSTYDEPTLTFNLGDAYDNVSILGSNNTALSNNVSIIGLNNTINKGLDNTFIMGNDVNIATSANDVSKANGAIFNGSVALGNDTTVTAPIATTSYTIGGVTYNFAGIKPVGTVSVGALGNERTITNVAAGRISNTSTDAINGSQLFALAQQVNLQANASTLHYLSVNDNGTQGNNYDNKGAQGKNSVAIGVNTSTAAAADYAVAMGYAAQANGMNTIAIGTQAKAIGNANNSNTVVIGNTSTSTNSNGSLTLGNGNITNDSIETIQLGSGNRADTSRSVAAIGGLNRTTGSLASSMIGINNSLVGSNSISITGINNDVAGSTLINVSGFNNDVTNSVNNSVIGNNNALNSGTNNFIAGFNNTLGSGLSQTQVLGSGITVSNNVGYGIAIGSGSQITQNNAVTLGANAVASQVGAVAIGANSVASTAAGIAGYVPASANATQTTAITNTTSTASAVSVGDAQKGLFRQITGVAAGTADSDAVNVAQLKAVATAASGNAMHYFSVNDNGVARNNYNNDGATAVNATAIGANALASSANALALGHYANATTNSSIAIGTAAYTGGARAVALGLRAKANGQDAIAIGAADAKGTYAVAMGFGATAADHTVAMGYNASAFGSSINSVYIGSNAGDGAANIGANNTATGYASFSNGAGSFNSYFGSHSGNRATGSNNIAMGRYAGGSVSGDNNIAFGNAAGFGVSGSRNIAIGTDAGLDNTTANDTVSLGTGAMATVDKSVALGANSVAIAAVGTASANLLGTTYTFAGSSPIASVSVGAKDAERTITNVAAGRISEISTDAINGSQLYAAYDAIGTLSSMGLNFTGNKGATVHRNLGQTLSIVGAEDGTLVSPINYQTNTKATAGNYSAKNVQTVTGSNGQVQIQLAEYPEFVGIKAGDAAGNIVNINNTGINITKGSKTVIIAGDNINFGGNTLTGVNPGEISGTSTDAINGSQLYNLQLAAGQGWNIQTNGDTASLVSPGATVDIGTKTGETNIKVSRNGNTIDFELNKNLDLGSSGSILLGNTTVNNNGVTITGGPSITINGIDAGGKTITNVAPGVSLTDAVNVSQLNNLGSSLTASGLNFTGSDGGVVHRDLGATLGIVGASKVAGTVYEAAATGTAGDYSSKNVQTVTDPTTGNIQIQLAERPEFDGIKAGDTAGNVINIDNTGINIVKGGKTVIIAGDTVNFGGNVINNIAAGVSLTDAVNVSQLNNLGSSLTASGLNFTGNKGATVHRDLGQTLSIIGAEDGTLVNPINYQTNTKATAGDYSAKNVQTVTGSNGQVQIQLAEYPEFVGIKAGDAAGNIVNINNTGINITKGSKTVIIAGDNINFGGNTLTGVNPGDISSTSTDAINGSQLYNLQLAAGQGWNIQTNGDTASLVSPGATVDIGTKTGETNIKVSRNGNTIDFELNKNLDLGSSGSILLGNTTVNNNGVTITGGPSITINGIDAGGKTITNVAPGVSLTDAVNVSQLNNLGSSLTASGLNFTGSDGGVVHRDLGATLGIVGASKVAGTAYEAAAVGTAGDYSSKNVQTVTDPTTGNIQIQLAERPEFDGIKAGDTAGNVINIDNTGINIVKGGKTVIIAGDTVNFGGNVINNIAAGVSLTDAVNVSQLNNLGSSLTASGLNFIGNKGATVHRDLGQTLSIIGAEDGTLVNPINYQTNTKATAGDYSAKNVQTVTGSNGQVQIQMADRPEFAGIKAGDTAGNVINIDNTGINIVKGSKTVIIAGDTVNFGGNVINNIAAGVSLTDAVNVSQLNNLGSSLTASGLNFTGSDGGVVHRDLGATLGIVGASKVAGTAYEAAAVGTAGDYSSKNVQTVTDPTTGNIQIQLAERPEFDGIKAGNTAGNVVVIDDKGINITGGSKTIVIAGNQVDFGGNTLSGVNPGAISSTSTDAINGSQLYNLQIAAGTGWNIQSNGDTATQVKPGDTVDIGTKTGENNIKVTHNGNTIDFELNKNLDLGSSGSIVLGNTTVNNNGVTITGGPSITINGIDAGGKTLTNVAPGVNGTDGVNVNQLTNLGNSLTSKGLNFVGSDGGVVHRDLGATLGIVGASKVAGTAYEAAAVGTAGDYSAKNVQTVTDPTTGNIQIQLAERPEFDGIKAGNATGNVVTIDNQGINITDGSKTIVIAGNKVDFGGNTLSGVNPGAITNTSTDAVNGSQLYNVQTLASTGWKIQSNGDGATQVKPGDTVDIGTKVGENNIKVTHNGNTIDFELNKNLDLGSTGSVKMGDLTINNGGLNIVNGPSITIDGIDAGGKTITNVAPGKNGTDAVNVDQLEAVQTTAGKGWNLQTDGDQASQVKPGDTVDIGVTKGEKNIKVSRNGNTVDFELNKNLDLGSTGSIVMGDVLVDGKGFTINNGPSMTVNGINAGNKTITNVAAGTALTDAVNLSQLNQAIAGSKYAGLHVQNGSDTILPNESLNIIGKDGTTVTYDKDSNTYTVSSKTGGTGTGSMDDWNVTGKDGKGGSVSVPITDGKNVEFAAGSKNVTVTPTQTTTGAQVQVDIARDLDLNSVTTKNADGSSTVVNGNGVTIKGKDGKNGASITQSGIDAGNQTLTNVAAGKNDTDAVNVSQLNAVSNNINNLSNRINEVEDNANAGTATAIAIANLPQAYEPGARVFAVAAGTYDGQTGYAVGYSAISDGGNWIIKASGTTNSQQKFGAGAGVGYRWR